MQGEPTDERPKTDAMEKEAQRVTEVLQNFSSGLSRLTTTLPKVLTHLPSHDTSTNQQHATSSELTPSQKARVYITLSYAANALFYMYLRIQGVDPKGHPVCDEIVRVYETWNRLKGVEFGKGKGKGRKGKGGGKKAIVELDRAMKELDKALAGHEGKKRDVKVAKRIIFNALGVNGMSEKDEENESSEEREEEEEEKEKVVEKKEDEVVDEEGEGDNKKERKKKKKSKKLNGVKEGRVKKSKSKDKERKKSKKSKKSK